MKRNSVLSGAAIGAGGVLCGACAAQEDRGYWRAASTNAHAITGDITVAEGK